MAVDVAICECDSGERVAERGKERAGVVWCLLGLSILFSLSVPSFVICVAGVVGKREFEVESEGRAGGGYVGIEIPCFPKGSQNGLEDRNWMVRRCIPFSSVGRARH